LSEAFVAWWANPVTAVMVALVTFLLLCGGTAAVVAVTRLGGIQLGALLAQHPRLLPGLPRKGDAYSTILLFLTASTGGVLILFTLAVVRAGQVAAAGTGGIVAAELLGWALAFALPLLILHGQRLEPATVLILASIRPAGPILRALSSREEEVDAGTEQDDEEDIDEHDLAAFIDAGTEAGILAPEDGKLIESILELGGSVAREIMTPRTDVAAVPVDAAFDAVRAAFAESMYTRLPVYRESLDRIEGVVHVKDVMLAAAAGSSPGAGALMRPVLIVPETKPLRVLLREFQAKRQQLAVVVDEYGGTSGIVTLEDVLEEIVGEIQDEHEVELPDVEEAGDGVFLVAGGAHVEILEELFGVEVDEEGFDSVAGLVLERLGHLPRPGEKLRWQGLGIEVLEVDRRRLRRVKVQREAAQ